MRNGRPNFSMPVKLVGAFAAVYVIWGTSYLATAIAVRAVSPLQLVCIRGLIGAGCLAAWQAIKGIRPPRAERRWLMWIVISGIVMLVGGHGLLFLGQRTAPSGISAVMLATIPLWMMVLDTLLCGRPTNVKIFLGVILGIAGVALLVFLHSQGKASLTLDEAFILLAAAGLWAAASLLTARRLHEVPAIPRATAQLFAGGVVAGLLSVIFPHSPIHIDRLPLVAILYLGIASSAFTFCAYNWLLTHTSPTAAGTYAFANPLVALGVGAVFAGERITVPVAIASLVVLGSVGLVLVGAKQLEDGSAASGDVLPERRPAAHSRSMDMQVAEAGHRQANSGDC
jgi:drug/metabolite transporter (DMT)-like permease